MNSNTPGLITILRTMFPVAERVRLAIVLLSVVVVALFEAIGVASIIPFMAVVMDPSALERYSLLRELGSRLGAESTKERLVLLGILTGLAVVLSNAASAFGLYVQQRFTARTRVRLTTSLFEAYLYQPYAFHTVRDSASLYSVIFGDAENATRLIGATVQLVARVLVIMALLSLLFLQNREVALMTLGGLGGCYTVVYLLTRHEQGRLGQVVMEALNRRNRTLQEGLGGIKDLIILGRENEKRREFERATIDFSYSQIANVVTSGLPKFLLEPIAFGGIVAVSLFLVIKGDGAANAAIPTLALYAFVGYRLMPALQQVFVALVDIRFTAPSLRSMEQDWKLVEERSGVRTEQSAPHHSAGAAKSGKHLEIHSVSFQYPKSERAALQNVSISIQQGQSIGLVGKTGSGKTTLADIILGLYEPSAGHIAIGDFVLTRETAREWRQRVGYVPQQVYLANTSVLENIAFGLPKAAIDRAQVESVAETAQAHEFISQLPEGYDTIIGERGIRLSGGQRQRLGIARALYNNPQILVFDEATSALDGMTEDAVMGAIQGFRGSRTVVLIAHRLRTVEACDQIIVLDAGAVTERGTFNELVARSDTFRQMARRAIDVPSAAADEPDTVSASA